MGLDKYENVGSFEEMAANEDANESVEETKSEATEEEATEETETKEEE